MSLNAATIEMLLSKGLSGADLLDVARAMETKSAAMTNAERQKRWRANQKAERNENNVTSVTPAPNDNISNPDQNFTPEETIVSLSPKPKTKRAAKNGEPLPHDWVPILTPVAQRIVDGWPPGWLDARISEFRDHASDKGRLSKDWQAAFRKWLTNADEWGRQKNGRNSQNLGRPADRRDGVARALDRQLGLDDMPLDGRSASGGGMDRDPPVAYLAAVR